MIKKKASKLYIIDDEVLDVKQHILTFPLTIACRLCFDPVKCLLIQG